MTPPYCLSSKTVVIDKDAVLDELGRPSYDQRGKAIKKNVTGRVHICPSCGQIIADKKGVPLGAKDLQKKGAASTAKACTRTYLQMLPAEHDKHLARAPTGSPSRHELGRASPPGVGHEVSHAGFKWRVTACKRAALQLHEPALPLVAGPHHPEEVPAALQVPDHRRGPRAQK